MAESHIEPGKLRQSGPTVAAAEAAEDMQAESLGHLVLRERGQITLPRRYRDRYQLQVGDALSYAEMPDGSLRLSPARTLIRPVPSGKAWADEIAAAEREIEEGEADTYADPAELQRSLAGRRGETEDPAFTRSADSLRLLTERLTRLEQEVRALRTSQGLSGTAYLSVSEAEGGEPVDPSGSEVSSAPARFGSSKPMHFKMVKTEKEES